MIYDSYYRIHLFEGLHELRELWRYSEFVRNYYPKRKKGLEYDK